MSDDEANKTSLVDVTSHEGQLHNTEIGQRIRVEREENSGEFVTDAAAALTSIGQAFGSVDPTAKHMKYVGSAAVHIFVTESLVDEKGKARAGFFSQVTTLRNTHPMIASDAMSDLQKAAKKYYGKEPGKLRSGW